MAEGEGQLRVAPERGWRVRAAVGGTLALHALLAWLATRAPAAPREEPRPRRAVSARLVAVPQAARPAAPEKLVVAPPPAPPPPPPKVAPPPPAPAPAEPAPALVPAAPAPAAAAPAPAMPAPAMPAPAMPAPAMPAPSTPKARPKRSGGRTLTAKGKGAAPTQVADGKGGVADFGDYDASARQGSATPPPPAPGPAGPGPREEPPRAGDAAAAPQRAPKAPTKAPEKLVPPVPLSRPSGRFPPGTPRSSQPLRVVLSLAVSASGEVTSVRVVSGQSPELDAEARRLATSIRFEPARRGGEAVPMTIPWTVTFK